jgi:hypothetical protein
MLDLISNGLKQKPIKEEAAAIFDIDATFLNIETFK